jgi:hypothetical protein
MDPCNRGLLAGSAFTTKTTVGWACADWRNFAGQSNVAGHDALDTNRNLWKIDDARFVAIDQHETRASPQAR